MLMPVIITGFLHLKDRYLIKRYYQIKKQYFQIKEKLKNPKFSQLEKSLLKIKQGNLVDEFHRMTFHISCCEEDNYDF